MSKDDSQKYLKRKGGFNVPEAKVQVYGKALKRLHDKNEGLTPELVVEAAKSPKHPLHGYFEWNNSAAARKYRLTQARHLIKVLEIEVHIVGDRTPKTLKLQTTRAYHHVKDPKRGRVYRSFEVVRDCEPYREQVELRLAQELERTADELALFRHLKQFSKPIKMIAAKVKASQSGKARKRKTA